MGAQPDPAAEHSAIPRPGRLASARPGGVSAGPESPLASAASSSPQESRSSLRFSAWRVEDKNGQLRVAREDLATEGSVGVGREVGFCSCHRSVITLYSRRRVSGEDPERGTQGRHSSFIPLAVDDRCAPALVASSLFAPASSFRRVCNSTPETRKIRPRFLTFASRPCTTENCS